MKNLFIILTVSAIVSIISGCATNPVTGEEEFMIFGPDYSQDVALGSEASEQVPEQLGPVGENQQVQNYINSVGQRIARISHAPDLPFEYKVITNDTTNAFALPGGYIYITTGMLHKLNSEAQLAAILAHETVHVTARHAAAQMSKDALIGAGISVLSSQSSSAAQIARVVAGLEGLKYSRQHETEADEYGLDYMVLAGYNPYAMVETMQTLEAESTTRPIEFLSTHPSPYNRKTYLKNLIEIKGYANTGTIGSEDYNRYVLTKLKK